MTYIEQIRERVTNTQVAPDYCISDEQLLALGHEEPTEGLSLAFKYGYSMGHEAAISWAIEAVEAMVAKENRESISKSGGR